MTANRVPRKQQIQTLTLHNTEKNITMTQQSCNTPLQDHLSVEKTLNSNHEYHPSNQVVNPETMLQFNYYHFMP